MESWLVGLNCLGDNSSDHREVDELVRTLSHLEITMESWLSGRKRLTANEVRFKRLQGFESLTLRQFSLLPETAECGVSQSDTQCQERATRQGFFKSKASVRSAMWKFEPIFLRKSRPCSGFSCKAIFSAWLVAFRKLISSIPQSIRTLS